MENKAQLRIQNTESVFSVYVDTELCLLTTQNSRYRVYPVAILPSIQRQGIKRHIYCTILKHRPA